MKTMKRAATKKSRRRNVDKSSAGRLTIKSVSVALQEANGNLSAAAKALNVHRCSVSDFIDKHNELIKVLNDVRQRLLDEIEAALYRNALSGNVAAQNFISGCGR